MFVIILILHQAKFISVVFSILQNALYNIAENYANNDENNMGNASDSIRSRYYVGAQSLRVDRRFDLGRTATD